MKIGTRFTLFQLTIVIGFFISAGVMLVLFSQSNRLKDLEVRATSSLTALNGLIDRTSIFTSRGASVWLLWDNWNRYGEASSDDLLHGTSVWFLWDDWNASFNSFRDLSRTVENEALNIRFLNEKSRKILFSKRKTRELLARTHVPSITAMVEKFDRQTINQAVGNSSMILARETLLDDGTLKSWIIAQAISEIDAQFKQLLPFLNTELRNNIEDLISELKSLNASVYKIILSVAIILILVFQLGSSFFVFRSSRSLGLNISRFEKNMSSVAEGDFNVNLEITTKDELADIARHFSTLTRDLWDRIDSLKNMMGNIEIQDDYTEMQKKLMNIAIEYSHADSAAIFVPVGENNLTLANSVGHFPPLAPLPDSIAKDQVQNWVSPGTGLSLAPLPDSIAKDQEAIGQWYKWYKNLEYIPEERNLSLAMSNGKPIFIKNNNDELIHNNNFGSPNYISSALFIPLIISGNIENILCLTISDIDRNFSELDFSFMQILGDFIVATLNNTSKYIKLVENQKISQEVEVATHIQKTILPTLTPKFKDIKVAAYSDAAEGIGGDYYDFFELGENKVAVIICDVSGKGIPASLMMIMIRTFFRSITELGKSSRVILEELNRLIIENADVDQFATVSVLIIDTENKTISYSNGASHPLYIFRAETRKFRIFDSDGLPIGIDINASYNQKNIKVQSRDYLVLFTDGLVEARNPAGEELGLDPILRLLASNSNREPDEIVQRIRNFIQNYADTHSQHDDQTLIAIKIV